MKPSLKIYDDPKAEIEGVAEWIKALLEEGFSAREIGIFVRSEKEFDRAEKVLKRVGLVYNVLDRNYQLTQGKATLCTMHLAKGLEFRAVVVMACDDDIARAD